MNPSEYYAQEFRPYDTSTTEWRYQSHLLRARTQCKELSAQLEEAQERLYYLLTHTPATAARARLDRLLNQEIGG